MGAITLSLLGIVSMRHKPVRLTEQMLDSGARFTPTECWFETGADTQIQCGWMHTASATFQLPVIIMHYQGMDREPDPVVYLAGGPGYAAWLDKHTVEAYWRDWFKHKSGMKRDLVLFDQRGSGLSKPDLSCKAFKTLTVNLLSNPGTPEENAQRYHAVNQQCHDELRQRGIPLNSLSTTTSAHDVHDLMQLLGYEQWNLLGVSYGTRLAFEVQRLFPDQVRSMSLDSVYPPGEHLMRDWPDLLNASLQRLFQHCANNNKCVAENGDLRERFQQLMTQLRQQPVTIPVTHLGFTDLSAVRLNDETLLTLLFDAQYLSHGLDNLASFIRHLQEGRLDAPDVRQYVGRYLDHQLDEAFHEAVFWSVECRDNPLVSREALRHKLDALPALRYYLPEAYDVCDVWNADNQSPPLQAAHEPQAIPALILSGEDDPITPQQWALTAAKERFVENKAYLFRFAGIAHGVMDSKPCANELFVNFVNEPDSRPSADCRFEPTTTQVANAP